MKKLLALIIFVLISVLAVACVAENNSSSPDESSAPVLNESSALPEMSEEDSVPEVSDEVSEEVSEEVSDEVSENSAPTVENSTDPDVNDETSQGEGVVSLEDYLFETGSFWGQNGEWLYYVDEDGALIGRVRLDGTGRLKYENKGIISANVETDRIYYVDNSDKHLYAMNHDGTGVTLLSDDEVSSSYLYPLKVNDGIVYYMIYGGFVPDAESMEDNNVCASIKIDGTDKRKYPAGYPETDGWVYTFSESLADPRVYKMRPDGSEKTLVIDEQVHSFKVKDGWIYYKLAYSDDKGLFRIKTDGTENEKLCNDNIENITNAVFDGDYIYYIRTTDDKNKEICSIKTDGSDCKKLSDKEAKNIVHVGDKIYFIVNDRKPSDSIVFIDPWPIYSVEKGGTDEQYICSGYFSGFEILNDTVWVIDTGIIYLTEGGNTYFYSFE